MLNVCYIDLPKAYKKYYTDGPKVIDIVEVS